MQRIVCPERDDWVATAESAGFDFHTIDGERYWDERAYYAFTLDQIERFLLAAGIAEIKRAQQSEIFAGAPSDPFGAFQPQEGLGHVALGFVNARQVRHDHGVIGLGRVGLEQ